MQPRPVFIFPLAVLSALFAGACASSPNSAGNPASSTTPARVAASTVPQAVAVKVDFAKDIKPFFQEYCYQCHGNGRQSGGVHLDVKSNAMLHITPGDPTHSDVYRAITRSPGASDHMPPANADQPDADDIAMIKQWILEGATWPDGS